MDRTSQRTLQFINGKYDTVRLGNKETAKSNLPLRCLHYIKHASKVA